MKIFVHLKNLIPYIDEAFESFYNTMLNDLKLSVFFDNDEQIRNLILKQKDFFFKSLDIPINNLKNMYIKLGEYHYDIRIPYVDFIKGTDILEEHFLLNSQKSDTPLELMEEIFDYFKIMKSYTAKGYLNRMLSEDKRDIESFFEQTNLDQETYLPKAIVLEKIQWLKDLLNSIENDENFDLSKNESIFNQWSKEVQFFSLEKRNFFEDLEKRIIINTQNLFYFLKKEEYLEILPLYSSLLNIYKLTLMMNNAVTLEYANKVIEEMKIDSLTKLFRKDIFEEILNKEIAFSKRDKNHKISIAYLDLDNFKSINDNFGHYTGDKVLEKLGECIRINIRSSDMAFRTGGDEFAIIFKSANKQQSKNVCKKIKVDFTSFEFIFNENITFNVGLSIGISEFCLEGKENIKNLLESVDKKLYEAKNRGKNQICL
jgi:diguanylate cyclase (GGDEF)-like protein